jgi:EpsI family protein
MSPRALTLAALFVVTTIVLARASTAEPTPIRESLSGLPVVLGTWEGQIQRDFAPEIVKVLGVDDYTTRSYFSPDGQRVGLYIGYHSSQRQGDSIHSPLNCLPGAGWTPTTQGRAVVTVADPATGADRDIEINRVVIERGLDRQLVLYWYQSHGRVVASEYWGKVYTVVDAIRHNRTDAALVRVIVPVASKEPEDLERADKAAREFVQTLFPQLGKHLPS